MDNSKISCIVAWVVTIVMFFIYQVTKDHTYLNILCVFGAAGTVAAVIRSKRLNRNPWVWGILCLFMPYIFLLVVGFLRSIGVKGENAKRYIAQESRKYSKHIISGAIWFIGGIAVTAGTFSAASGKGGTYFICWGAILFGGLEFIVGVLGWLATFGERRNVKLLNKHHSEQIRIAKIDDANQYPVLNKILSLVNEESYGLAVELLLEELTTVHKKNKNIHRNLTKRFYESLFAIYRKYSIFPDFDLSNYCLLVKNFRKHSDTITNMIEKYGQDSVTLNSPNFGAGLSDEEVDSLYELNEICNKLDKQIVDLITKLPKLSGTISGQNVA